METEGGTPPPSPEPPKLVQATQSNAHYPDGITTTLEVNLQHPATEGNLLVLAIGDDTYTTGTVQSVTDDASDVFTSTHERATDDGSHNSDEVWYAKASGGVTTITVTMTAAITYELWAFEVSGVSTPDIAAAQNAGAPPSRTAAAPAVTPSVENAFVVSLLSTSSGVNGLVAGSPFTFLQAQNGNDAAYLITTAKGSYGATFTLSDEGTASAVTVAFR